jgi:CHAP domain-containing protein
MQRMLRAALAAFVIIMLTGACEAHNRTLYRTKCAGMYCWPVAEPQRNRKAATTRKAWHRHARPHRLARRGQGTPNSSPPAFARRASADKQGGGEHTSSGGAYASAPVSTARRYLGGNPTGWAHVWCGAFMRLVMRASGYPDLPSGNLAAAWARYGRSSAPAPGAVVVWPHHVGLITAVHGNGTATVISGNDGHRVRERVLSVRGAIAYRTPG